MKSFLIYDQYDETYREVIDVKELKEYILKKIEEIKDGTYDAKIVLQSFIEDLEVEDD